MFEYKDAKYFNEYFGKISEIKLSSEFTKSEDNCFNGQIEVLNSFVPLFVDVEIPLNFPHQKLKFFTKSLKGYPHLIELETDPDISWFCLNAPFAETVEEQLNVEIDRLLLWTKRYLREDLPTIIDSDTAESLQLITTTIGQNFDEMSEYRKDAQLIFIGDFCKDIDHFIDEDHTAGYLYGNLKYGTTLSQIQQKKLLVYVTQSSHPSNIEIPYIIVDELPSKEILKDFVKLSEFFGWGKDTKKNVLPGFSSVGECTASITNRGHISFSEIKERLNDEQLPSKHKDAILSYIEKEINDQNERGLTTEELLAWWKDQQTNPKNNPHFNPDDDIPRLEHEHNITTRMFALGVKNDDYLEWYLFYSFICLQKYESFSYTINDSSFTIHQLVSIPLCYSKAAIYPEKMFFGRGLLSNKLTAKRICIIGLGAIGSKVATSLVRGGCKDVALYDSDDIEPGNICRSSYSLSECGGNKSTQLADILHKISPFVKITAFNSDLYGRINYQSQQSVLNELSKYDLVFECTGNIELLHFLGYVAQSIPIVSLGITNRAQNLLCISNKEGNPYELRRMYLSKIEQDTKNFYVEGTGCYSPTFLATDIDISTLVNLALRDINKSYERNGYADSSIISYCNNGVLTDKFVRYKLLDSDITLTVTRELLLDADEMDENLNHPTIGYVLGGYSEDCKDIMITHFIGTENAVERLTYIDKLSKGVIDYIGDFTLSGASKDEITEPIKRTIINKANDYSINTRNPILVLRNPDSTLSFFIYKNNIFKKFIQI